MYVGDADEQGLGKTIQMLSLIVSEPPTKQDATTALRQANQAQNAMQVLIRSRKHRCDKQPILTVFSAPQYLTQCALESPCDKGSYSLASGDCALARWDTQDDHHEHPAHILPGEQLGHWSPGLAAGLPDSIIIHKDIPGKMQQALKDMLAGHSSVWASSDADIGICNVHRHRIDTGNAPPRSRALTSYMGLLPRWSVACVDPVAFYVAHAYVCIARSPHRRVPCMHFFHCLLYLIWYVLVNVDRVWQIRREVRAPIIRLLSWQTLYRVFMLLSQLRWV